MESDGDIAIRIERSEVPPILTPQPSYSEAYLDDQMRKAKPAWEPVPNPDVWLEELRGGRGHAEDVIYPFSHGH